LYQKD